VTIAAGAYSTSQQVAGYAAALRPHCLHTGNNSSYVGGSLKAYRRKKKKENKN